MKGTGGLFERQVLASVPKWAYGRKVPDPPARPFRCRCGGQISPKCDRCGQGHGHPAKFTRRHPWDVEVRWLAAQKVCGKLPQIVGVVMTRFELLIECKSTAGPRLDFDVLERQRKDGTTDRSQIEAMSRAAEAGVFAGVLWECRSPLAVYYLPIGVWLALEQTIGRKSLPLAVAASRGIRVDVDPDRGRVHTYYRLGALMEELAGRPIPAHPPGPGNRPAPEERQKTLF